MAFQTFEDLEVWKRGCRQAVAVCKLFNHCQNWSLRDQIQRAAISVPSNIAEGQERDSRLDFIRFLRIAKGSNGEMRTQLYIAAQLELIPREQLPPFAQESKEIAAMLQGLVNSLRRAGAKGSGRAEN